MTAMAKVWPVARNFQVSTHGTGAQTLGSFAAAFLMPLEES